MGTKDGLPAWAIVLLVTVTLLVGGCRTPDPPAGDEGGRGGEPTTVVTDTAPQHEGDPAPGCGRPDPLPAPAVEGIGFVPKPHWVHTHITVSAVDIWYGRQPIPFAPLAGMLTQAFLEASLPSEEEHTQLPPTVATCISHPRSYKMEPQHVWIYLRFPSTVRGKLGVGHEKTVELTELVLYATQPGSVVMMYLLVDQDAWLAFPITVTYEQIKDYVDEATRLDDPPA